MQPIGQCKSQQNDDWRADQGNEVAAHRGSPVGSHGYSFSSERGERANRQYNLDPIQVQIFFMRIEDAEPKALGRGVQTRDGVARGSAADRARPCQGPGFASLPAAGLGNRSNSRESPEKSLTGAFSDCNFKLSPMLVLSGQPEISNVSR